MIVRTMSRMYTFAGAAILAGAALWQTPADAEQWAYAMQTGHGNHSIQVDVDSIMQRPGYVGARLLFEYYWNAANLPASGTAPRSALVDGAFDCKGKRFQVLNRTEYALAEGQGTAGATSHAQLAPERWKPAGADPETFAIIDWVCGVAERKLAEPQAGSIP
jgi:hypothetical protein